MILIDCQARACWGRDTGHGHHSVHSEGNSQGRRIAGSERAFPAGEGPSAYPPAPRSYNPASMSKRPGPRLDTRTGTDPPPGRRKQLAGNTRLLAGRGKGYRMKIMYRGLTCGATVLTQGPEKKSKANNEQRNAAPQCECGTEQGGRRRGEGGGGKYTDNLVME